MIMAFKVSDFLVNLLRVFHVPMGPVDRFLAVPFASNASMASLAAVFVVKLSCNNPWEPKIDECRSFVE